METNVSATPPVHRAYTPTTVVRALARSFGVCPPVIVYVPARKVGRRGYANFVVLAFPKSVAGTSRKPAMIFNRQKNQYVPRAHCKSIIATFLRLRSNSAYDQARKANRKDHISILKNTKTIKKNTKLQAKSLGSWYRHVEGPRV